MAAYTATIAITEDTSGSTNTPAARNHLFGYDPPKFHYPNQGNPSLTVRNDQLGVNARNIDDIVAFDKAVLGTSDAHSNAKALVEEDFEGVAEERFIALVLSHALALLRRGRLLFCCFHIRIL